MAPAAAHKDPPVGFISLFKDASFFEALIIRRHASGNRLGNNNSIACSGKRSEIGPLGVSEPRMASATSAASLVEAARLGTTSGTPIEIWFQNEARVGQKGTDAYIWTPVGTRPLMVRDNCHDSAYIFGAICPSRGVGPQ